MVKITLFLGKLNKHNAYDITMYLHKRFQIKSKESRNEMKENIKEMKKKIRDLNVVVTYCCSIELRKTVQL
jgi:hypothetical protein